MKRRYAISIKLVFMLFILFVLLALAVPVLASYLGPDRTVTSSYVDTYDYGVWAQYGKACKNINGQPSDCIICQWDHSPDIASCATDDPTYYWYKLGTHSEVITTTNTLPSATINSTLQSCLLQNGWCTTSPTLSLVGNEPVFSYNILAIEGTLNGQTFGCSGSTCSVPLIEGNNSLTFWALSSYGDSSMMGTFSAKVDTVAPDITGTLTGTSGDNGWFVSDITLFANPSDTTSDLASFVVSIDGGAFTTFTSPVALSEGAHTVQLQAQDNAGNTTNITQTVNVDTTAPQVLLTGNNAFCPVCGEALSLSVTAQDALGGIAEWTLDVDGTTLQTGASNQVITWNGDNLSAGNHILTLRAKDLAGNIAETSLSVGLLAPTPTATATGTALPLPTATAIAPSSSSSNTSSSNAVIMVAPTKTPTAAPTFIPTKTPQPTKAQSVVAFGKTAAPTATPSAIVVSQSRSSSNMAQPTNTSSPIVWGSMAAAMVGAVTAFALDEQRKRKQEEANQRAEAETKAAQMNAAEETRKAQNWLAGKAALDVALKQAAAFGATPEEIAAIKAQAAQQGITSALNTAKATIEIAQARAAEQAEWIAEQEAKNAQFVQDQRALEAQKAEEAKQAEQARQKALQDHLMSEHADSPLSQPHSVGGKVPGLAAPVSVKNQSDECPWWNLVCGGKLLIDDGKKIMSEAKEWVNMNIIQPAGNAWNESKDWAFDHFVQPVKNIHDKVTTYINALPPSPSEKIYAVFRDVAIHTIPPAAEFIYTHGYIPVVSFAQDHPMLTEKTTQVINSVLDTVVRPVLNRIVDTNPNTMNWMDLGLTWLFELGDKDELAFNANSTLTQDIMKHAVVQELRDAAIEKITDGRLTEVLEDCLSTGTPIPDGQYPVCMPSQYGVAKFVQSLGTAARGDLSYEYLGSYVVTINVEPLGDDRYIFHYYIKNPSTWESATRFRIDKNGDGINEGFIPDTSPRGEGIELGGFLNQTFEWAEEIHVPTEK